MDMSPYRELFVSEARSHLTAFSELLVKLEDSPNDIAAINELFRHAHSLKGMSATMGYDQVVVIAHLMEDQLARIRSGESRLLPDLTDLLLEGGDTLGRIVSLIESGSNNSEDTTRLEKSLAEFDSSSGVQNISEAEQPIKAESPPQQNATSGTHQFRQADTLKSIRIKTETLDHLVNITGELITNRYRLAESIRQADAVECLEPLRQLTMLLRSLRDEVFKARMLPFSFIAERFPRLVRDLARKQGKEVNFELRGKEIELDRGILEEIAEPIVHILRNAVDHGLESADERVMSGKPFEGKITLTVSRDKDHVEIEIADNGRGIDPEQLKLKAIEKGVITVDQAAQLTSQEALQLVCKAGFSTASAITDISGRGVGMDAVREAVHALTGVLSIQSVPGQGSRFLMRLPITVSIIHAMLVRSGRFEIAFPLNVVKRTLEIKSSEIYEESGRQTIIMEDQPVHFQSLRNALHIPETAVTAEALIPAIVCDVAGELVAFGVDCIIDQQEIFVRPLRSPLSYLRGVSGATIAGDGRVLFVADVNALA